jgi:hypothetical protein
MCSGKPAFNLLTTGKGAAIKTTASAVDMTGDEQISVPVGRVEAVGARRALGAS